MSCVLTDNSNDWVYKDINEIFSKHPECKVWFFCNGCGANLYFISGVIENLYKHCQEAIHTGTIGFVTSSGSGLPVVSLRLHDPHGTIPWETLYCFIYNSTGDNLYDNIYKWVYNQVENSKKWEFCKSKSNFKHIVITTVVDTNSKITWFYHDCSTTSNIPDKIYIKTAIASAYFGFMDPQSNWKGINLSTNTTQQHHEEKCHLDGWIWYNPPQNTIDLFNLIGINCYSVTFFIKAIHGLLFASRNKCSKWYISGYEKCESLLLSKNSVIYNILNDYIQYPSLLPTQHSFNENFINKSNRIQSLWNVLNISKLYQDSLFVSKLFIHNYKDIYWKTPHQNQS
tara:strand:- start:2875 stop:3897 length:1023 start_codon:yes stop_codon:yes gene_type:complete